MAFKSFVLTLFGLAPEQKEERELFKKSLEKRECADAELEELLKSIKSADRYFEEKAAELQRAASSMRPVPIFTEPEPEAEPHVFRRPHPSHAG